MKKRNMVDAIKKILTEIDGTVEAVNFNEPKQTVIAGKKEAIREAVGIVGKKVQDIYIEFEKYIDEFEENGEKIKSINELKMINDKLPTQIMGAFDKMLATDKKSSPKSIEEFRSYVDFMAKQVSLDATHVAYKPVQTRYGTAVTGDLRGSLIYDGFRNTDSLIGYAVPTDKGVSLQLLLSDDSSHDYWANELNHMYQTQSLKGGK